MDGHTIGSPAGAVRLQGKVTMKITDFHSMDGYADAARRFDGNL